jgi:RNA polymerase sigma-70 factor (ECF subfamily)
MESTNIAAMLKGDERAFTAFFDSYFPRVYRFALPRLGGDGNAATEVVQATLVKAMRKLADFRSDASLFTWVCSICRHEVVDWLRAQRRHADKIVLMEDSPELRAAVEAIAAPEMEEPGSRYSRENAASGAFSTRSSAAARWRRWRIIRSLSVDESVSENGITRRNARCWRAVAFRVRWNRYCAAARDVLASLLNQDRTMI